MLVNNILYDSANEIEFSIQASRYFRLHTFPSYLVQVFLGTNDPVQAQQMLDRIVTFLPKHCVVIGASTSGEILEGQMHSESTVVSICGFEQVQLQSAYTSDGSDYHKGQVLAQQVVTDTSQAAILFMEGLYTNGEEVVKGFSSNLANQPLLAGGMAGDNMQFKKTLVVHGHKVYDCGAVAVSLNSERLQVRNAFSMSWLGVGPMLQVTKSELGRVYELNHRPIVEVYSELLGQRVVDRLPESIIEFPLVIEGDAHSIARSAVHVYEDLSVQFAGNLEVGTLVRLGVANISQIEQSRLDMRQYLHQFNIEACFIYSCTARKAFLGNELEREFAPLQSLASTAGFFTYGELFQFNVDDDSNQTAENELLNITTTVLALSESNLAPEPLEEVEASAEPFAHERLSNDALIHFVNETTQAYERELQEKQLKSQLLEQYERAIDTAFMVLKLDLEGRIQFANARFEQITGFLSSEVANQALSSLLCTQGDNIDFTDVWTQVKRGQNWSGLVRYQTRLHQELLVRAHFMPIQNEDHQSVEILCLHEWIQDPCSLCHYIQ